MAVEILPCVLSKVAPGVSKESDTTSLRTTSLSGVGKITLRYSEVCSLLRTRDECLVSGLISGTVNNVSKSRTRKQSN